MRRLRYLVPVFFYLFLPFGALAAQPTVLVLGDSLSAAYGIPRDRGWVALLQQRLRGRGHRVVNASISGDTSRGGLSRLPRALELHRPSIVVIELGANDGLRGFLPDNTRGNLERMVELSRKSGAKVLLLGVHLPANYGSSYRQRFHSSYLEVAKAKQVALVPFFLAGVAETTELMQADGIHPSAAAQPRILDNVWEGLKPLLNKDSD